MRRLLWVGVGLGLVGAGLVVALRGGPHPEAKPLDQIDADSRRQLERVLEHATEEEGEDSPSREEGER